MIVRLYDERAALVHEVCRVRPRLVPLVHSPARGPAVDHHYERVLFARLVVVRVIENPFDLFVERALPLYDFGLGDLFFLKCWFKSVSCAGESIRAPSSRAAIILRGRARGRIRINKRLIVFAYLEAEDVLRVVSG